MATVSAAGATMPRASLFVTQIADETMLREGWYRVQRGGRAAGVDGMTVDAFRPRAERRLTDLSEALISDTYRPSAVKRVQIPKPSGGWRILGIPTIADRIVQTAASIVLQDRVAAQFSDRSFAYRPFLGPRRAAMFLRGRLDSGSWVVTADIEKFFDNVEHRILADQLRHVGVDDAGVRIVQRWLLAPAQERGRVFQPVKGLPQGSPVAPVLANLYLTGFDTALEAEDFTHVRYADDFVVLAGGESDAHRALRYVSTYLSSRLHLGIKPAKTQLVCVEDGFNFVGFRFTGRTWTVPSESVVRLREAVTRLLDPRNQRTLAEVAKSHNDLVRGWRHYYFGNSAEMDQQLGDLDTWRADACRAHLTRLGLDPDSGAVWFERLCESVVYETPAGTYATGPETEDPVAAAPEPIDEWHQGVRHAGTARETGRFSTERAIRHAEIGYKQVPSLLEDGWLRIPTFGGFVTTSRALLSVRRKKQVIFECAWDDVSCLTIEARGVTLSTTVIDECSRRRIPIVVCRLSGKPIAHLISVKSPILPNLVRTQMIASMGRTGTPLACSILAAKLANQRALLLYHSKYQGRSHEVRRTLIDASAAIAVCALDIDRHAGTPLRDARQPLFLLEAKAAAHYWRAFSALIPPALRFGGRAHQDASDVVNKVLNYGYALLLGHVWIAVRRAGFEPSLGLLHTGRRKSAGLVFDLMEPFRQPVVDRTVLALVGRGSRLALNEAGDLTLRSRALLRRAFVHRLAAPGRGGGRRLLLDIQRRTIAFRRALTERTPYDAFRMTW